ncbi:MAG: NAD(P)-dependent oxidoreductase [Armatimonadetes bacterium]|nr:NAD(P)-dependent oxidoreductase [Armatimonadota bacterium]
MSKNILITGVSGFIGKHVARELLLKKYDLTVMIRPKTEPKRISEFKNHVNFVEIDLTDIDGLRSYLKEHSFDTILHIGAIRGGRKFSKKKYFDANVNATEQLIINAQTNNSRFIFCSSVGVFGAIPDELPANNSTLKKNDNYYHYTKIQSEALIQKYVLYDLNAVIVRPAITYGSGDFGFPFTLVKLVDKNLMFLPNNETIIHLTNIELLVMAFTKLIEFNYKPGIQYIVADKNPVNLHELVNFICKELKNKTYSDKKSISEKFFKHGEKIARCLKNELWTSRFELISKSWYYDVSKVYKELSLQPVSTIPNFKIVTNWYKQLKEKK